MGNVNRWLREFSEHPHLMALYYRGIQDFDSLEGADLVGFSALVLQLFTIYEEMYFRRWTDIWIAACGVFTKLLCAISTHILEFRPGGVHARIGSMRSLRSTLISYRRQLRLQGCIAKQI
jgi:hypothetical protein